MKLKEKIIQKLNEHYQLNFQLGIKYLSFSQKASKVGLVNLSAYIKQLADDKLTIHKDKLFNYLLDQDACLDCMVESHKCDNLNQPKDIIKEILKLEEDVRVKINELSQIAISENDYETFHFLTWFVNDGLKDFNEIKAIVKLFSLSDDILSIDQAIKEIIDK